MIGCLFAKTARTFILITFVSIVTIAQSGTSSVRGTLTDTQGRTVPGATVTLLNPEKSFSRTQVTNQDGTYSFTSVPPGTYQIRAEAAGFKRVLVDNVLAQVDTPNETNVHLEVGDVNESVTVTGTTETPLNTNDATLGNGFERKRIVDLPLNANNVVGLLSLQPGVTRSGYVNGGRSDQANVTLDGVDVNEQQTGLDVVTDEAFASVLRSTRDSLQEFRVTTSNPNAEQGRSSGAQVSLVTRSGTNEFHGSLYETHRNTVTTANDFFSNAAGSYGPDDFAVVTGNAKAGDPRVPRPQLLRNVFGGSIGGPIVKNKVFFFFNYEGFREASETPVVREVPLPSLGLGIVKYQNSSGGVSTVTPSQVAALFPDTGGENPAVLAVLANAARKYPVNDATVGDGLNTGGFRFNAKTPSRLNTYIARVDFNLTSRQTIFVRANYQSDLVTRNVYGGPDCGLDFTADNIQCFPDTPALTVWNHPKGIAFGHIWTLSNSVVNRFTYGYTRASFTNGGELNQNNVSFRFIFNPVGSRYALSRTTPVHNFVDDVSWIKGNHNFGFGGNVRLIKNNRTSLNASYDNAVINPSFYAASGAVLTQDENGDPLFPDAGDNTNDLRDALASVIGRYSQYSALLVYDKSGSIQPVGTPTQRTFATQEYELYWQDSWRMRPNLTINYGLRWSTSTPVYEANGVEVAPTPGLGDYFNQRVASSANGVPFNDPITFNLAGKVNNKPGYYKQDWNNFAPAIGVAWSPDFGDNFFGKLVGRSGKSVFRSGFRMTYDRIGSQLAVNFDLNSLAGFTAARNINANTFDVRGSDIGPQFTGFNPNVRSLPFPGAGPIPPNLTFPLTVPSDQDQRIEVSLDNSIKTPVNYSVNFSYGRELGKGLSIEASYVGRFGRNLLATRDIMQLNNIRDPQSGLTWYQAMGKLIDARYANTPISQIRDIPFFNNLFPFMPQWFGDTTLTPTQAAYATIAKPSVGGLDIVDYTTVQLLWDDSPNCINCPAGPGPAKFNNTFFQPQFGALSAFSTVARSNYNSMQISLRQRLRNDITFDFNYTYGHSLDNASGLQNSNSYGTAFIVNALNLKDAYADSDFDVRHIISADWVVGIPFGRGKTYFHDAGKVVNGILGDWQTTGIFRWNTGLPVLTPNDCCVWATNWNVQSFGVRVHPLTSSVTKNGSPNLFSDPSAAYQSFRPARPGEGGDRNVLRGPGYISLDMGLTKDFRLPWEGQSIQFRWEVFNVTNTQRFDGSTISDLSLGEDPFLGGQPRSDFGKFTSTQSSLNETKAGRVMQFSLRYQF